ncbi:hypothetical protein [Frondihabitans australicus]|nr:hypothetical protein [Frondihabitans australicus]
MSRPIKLRRAPQFTVDIVDDARASLVELLRDLEAITRDNADDIEVWASAVTTAGWEIARLGQWLGLEGEAALLLGGASYPEIAEHQGTSASNVYNRVGRSLTLAPYARAAGSVAHVSAEALEEARRDYAAETVIEGDAAAPGGVGEAGETLVEKVLAILRPGPSTTAEIVAALPEYRRSSVLSTLSVLARRDAVTRVGHGVYALPDH